MEVDRVTRVVARVEAEGMNSLHHNLAGFIHVLRHLGLRVSVAEALDAYQALTAVDLMQKERVKAALQAVLVKDRAGRALFGLAFDRFFVTPEEKRRRQQLRRQWEEEQAIQQQQAAAELQEAVRQWHPDYQFTGEQVATFARLPSEQRRRFKEIMGRMRGNPVNDPHDLIAQVIQSSLNYWRYYLMKNRVENQPPDAVHTGREDLDAVIAGVAADFYRDPDEQIMHADMQNITGRDVDRMTALIQRLSAQLASRLSRRYRRSRLHRQVDIRRTIRRNLRYGGTPLELSYRARRAHKPRLLLICDVSASMARYARFVLQFVYGLSSAVQEIESFVFSEDLERITPFFKHGRNFTETMTGLINESRQWGQTTNLGAALQTFERLYRPLLKSDTHVLIVSDAKTIAPEKAAGLLAVVRRQAREIIWLNPVPEREWQHLPGLAAFREQAGMFECYTPAHLEDILRRQLKKI
ncbi:VWA domain-containing protein [Desulfotomaculum copahuensis]|uniref:VWA domain-containing protein n=1 Tax=Desulfotomaculum copahuensis TaxID=1838280 RepID=A0A1B7LH26_9FIRM|nr:VWA domain-containing protein [Desulfotomaculum copahuensis]OAT85447.1 hypothetical protein A6M21_05875 [Desulfotomaculum copahuensis]